jgi:hypothetical protein
MSRMSWPTMGAVVLFGVLGLMMVSGQWRPRVVEKDAAGMVVGGTTRPLAPGTRILSGPDPVAPEIHNATTRSRSNFP